VDRGLQLELRRHGYFEEGHFTVAYSPVPDETAPRGIGGVVATVHEISATVFAERRVAALRDLGSRAGEARTPSRPARSRPKRSRPTARTCRSCSSTWCRAARPTRRADGAAGGSGGRDGG
jgi:hypothetical protein